jgi:hypothetical protein
MFQQRQLNDLYQLMEVSFTAAVAPGIIASGAAARVSTTCTTGSPSSPSQDLAQFNIGDNIEVIAPASAGNLAGLIIQAWPSAQGTCLITFYNQSGGNITPVSANYTIVAKRITAQLL